ncbi:class A beta-lactamase-related serine hydrolase [Flagellimonas lutimaris]|uniref:Class A beta-lactamase-related serine hydrolase n=1 Tax=Flagellimonas lutimaris TaxID=475082 RepID=A0A3A1NDW7_9FLAO|nr:serine hydrolase domain-containing protein [Allomuricauda lutimaris]RIV36532.1 class A beta-lactamase-related serine hydrolase [Allomuricauda lutimaris]
MKQILLLTLSVLLLGTSCQNEKAVSNKSSLEIYADSLFQESVDSSQIAGGAILVFQNGEKLLKKSYGYASIELTVPMPENAQFEIGSVTKQFTAAAILKLVETKKLSLEDDFTDYIPFDTKGRKITINNLLNHTSGIPSYTEIGEFWDLSIQEHPRDSLVRLVERNDFLFEPNEALIYNNSAYFFLGLIIEKVTEQSYEEFLKQEFFEPLVMNSTNYCSNSKVVKNKVYGYNYSPNGLQQKPYLNHTWPYSAGSLCSTTEDLLIWMRALHTGKVLTEPMYQTMISPDNLNDGTSVSYAKGLVNFSNFGHNEIAHGGGIHGFLSDTRYFPEEDLYIICLINTTGPRGGSFFAEEITWKLLDKKEYKQVELDSDFTNIQGTYTGAVRGANVSLEVKSIKNGITLQAVGNDQIDTLKVYIGNNTWMDGNDKITIENNEFRKNNIYNYYILEKEK